MIGLVIVAHGGLATELLAATEHVVGKLDRARAVEIAPDDDLAAKKKEVACRVREVDDGDGVVIVTDMFGGSPSNLAVAAESPGGTEVVYGANLPLLVKLAKSRRLPLREAANVALEAGRKYLDMARSPYADRKRLG